MREPGNLNAFDTEESKSRWRERIRGIIDAAIDDAPGTHFVSPLSVDLSASVSPELIPWKAEPARVRACLSSKEAAFKLADCVLSREEIEKSPLLTEWVQVPGDFGRGLCQEEYLEWRTIKDADGRITGVEMTSESPEYWNTLAAFEPEKLLETIAAFAGEDRVPVEEVYGFKNGGYDRSAPFDPFEPGVAPADRERQFRGMMYAAQADLRPPLSPYNNGRKAICFMYKRKNSLQAAVRSIAAAAFPYVKNCGGKTSLANSVDIILNADKPIFKPRSIACQSSDATIVGAVSAHAFNGRSVTLADPIGIYIVGFAAHRLLLPDGSSLASKTGEESWIRWDRGDDGSPARHQRLTIKAPKKSGLALSDLTDKTSREKITAGSQIARLCEVGVYLQTFGSRTTTPVLISSAGELNCKDQADCRTFKLFAEAIG